MDLMVVRRKILLAGGAKPSRLPAGYREVEFIAAKNATPNIDMGFTLQDELEAEIHYYNSKNEAFVFGCRHGMSNSPYCNLNIESSNSPAVTRFDYGSIKSNDYIQKFPFKLGEFIFTFHNRIAKLENLTDHTYTQVDFSNSTFRVLSRNLFLFAANTNGTISKGDTNGTLAIYSAKFWVGGELVRDYAPCVRKSDNVAGMYDLVSGQFYIDAKTPFATEL